MPTITDVNYVDSLLAGLAFRWNAPAALGTPATVTDSFMTAAPSYADPTDRAGFAPLTAVEQAAVREALALWASVANIAFVEVSDAGRGGQIRVGTNNQGTVSSSYAYYADPNPSNPEAGDVYLNNRVRAFANPVPGTPAFTAILHEIGHAIGLKHPGDYNAGSARPDGPFLPAATDNDVYTVMSYHDATSGLSPVGPMIYDILAAQVLYGANMATRAGDDTYTFTDSARQQAIWDGGGIDQIDAAAVIADARIDLTPGTLSDIGRLANGQRATNDLGIALNVVIENVIGGAGNDTVIGNEAGNAIAGNGGDDILLGQGGDDVLDAGGGTVDQLIGGTGNDVLIGGSGTDNMLGGSGADLFVERSGGGTDAVFDFTPGEGDRIQLAAGINGTGLSSADDAVALAQGSGQDSFIYLGKAAGVDQWLILVGVATVTTADFVIGPAG